MFYQLYIYCKVIFIICTIYTVILILKISLTDLYLLACQGHCNYGVDPVPIVIAHRLPRPAGRLSVASHPILSHPQPPSLRSTVLGPGGDIASPVMRHSALAVIARPQ
jgi:hypothetical protein